MRIIPIAMVGLLTGCQFDEKLRQKDLRGKVRIPKEALTTLTLIDDNGFEFLKDGKVAKRDWDKWDATGELDYVWVLDGNGDPELDDSGERIPETIDISSMMGLIGPVYLGAFPSVEEGHYDYMHPEMGPILDEQFPGDTYPYGGTTIGRFDYGCYEQLVCKVVTGRYTNYGEILDFFRKVVQEPVLGPDGVEVTSGVTYQEQCFEGRYLTSDDELAFLDDEPYETDESLGDYFKPYFKDKGDFMEADVIIPHAYFEEGMALWGWVDMPSQLYSFATCDETTGSQIYRYSEQFRTGTNYPNVLNYPGLYIDKGDWIVNDAAIVTDPDKDFVVEMGYKYED